MTKSSLKFVNRVSLLRISQVTEAEYILKRGLLRGLDYP